MKVLAETEKQNKKESQSILQITKPGHSGIKTGSVSVGQN